MDSSTFKISRGSIIYAPRPEDGHVSLTLNSGDTRVDLVGHLFDSPRMPEYRATIYYAPRLLELLQQVLGTISDGRKSLKKTSPLGKEIAEVLSLVDQMRSQQ